MAAQSNTANTEIVAQPFEELADELKLPISTLYLLRARGEGPRTFKLGRRLYVSNQAKRDWIAQREQGAAA